MPKPNKQTQHGFKLPHSRRTKLMHANQKHHQQINAFCLANGNKSCLRNKYSAITSTNKIQTSIKSTYFKDKKWILQVRNEKNPHVNFDTIWDLWVTLTHESNALASLY